jgi:O-succinylbenzoic acid--CoA ligase
VTHAPDPLLERIRQDPDALALRAPSATWTRTQLLGAADDLARALHGEGLGQDRRVACLLDEDAPAVTLIHAARRLGAVHIPLNRRASAMELRAQLERSGADGLLCDASNASRAREAAPKGIATHRIEALLAGARCAVPPRLRDRIDLLAPATIVYTSGTTGRPKGALLTHDNHRASAHAWAALLHPRPGDRWLLCVPLFHVAGLAIVTRATRWGAVLEVQDHFDPAAVSAAIDDGVTHISLVAAQLVGLLADRADRPVPSTLRAILLGGGPMPAELLRRARAAGYPLLTTYGLTETGSGVVSGGADQATLDDPAAGRALPGVELRLAADGEILVRGEMVFAGYIDDEAAAARALPGDGWLHTGDQGTLEGGLLRIDARRDDLIISGGENIAPAEIEAVLESHPGVAEAAVVGMTDERWGAVPRAYIVTHGPQPPSDAELDDFCRARLAGFKVPTGFVRLEALPRNPMGKVARAELARMAAAGRS